MAAALRFIALLAAALVAFAGIAIGANLQEERFLDSDDERDFGRQPGATGNLIPVTALLVALGCAVGAAILSRQPWRQRLAPALAVAVGTWLTVVLVQSNYPNYTVLVEARFAQMTISPIILDADGVPLLMIPAMALLAGGILLAGWGLRRLWTDRQLQPDGPGTDGRRLYHGHVGLVLLCLPFLFTTALGALGLLIALRVQEPGHGLALALLPLLAGAALAITVLILLRTWALAEAASDPRMALVSAETWRALGRIQAIATGSLAALAIAGSFLPRTSLPEVELGRVLVFSLRSAVQAPLLCLFPLAVLGWHGGRVQKALDRGVILPAFPAARRHALSTVIVVAVALCLAGLGVIVSPSALLPWTIALVILALLAATTLPALPAAPVMMLGAAALWGHGNTIAAIHNPRALTLLDFHVNPGVLILWSLAGVALLAWTIGRLVRAAGPRVRSAVALPMAVVVGFALAVIVWLNLSFTAWIVPGQRGDGVAIGSLLRSLPTNVRTAIHTFNALLALVAALALARVVRPDWFSRRPRSVIDDAADSPGDSAAQSASRSAAHFVTDSVHPSVA